MFRFVSTNHSVINDDYMTVKANHCVINGDKCLVIGDYCVINGERCIVEGKHTALNANHAIINGEYFTGLGVSSFRGHQSQTVTIGKGLGMMHAPDLTFGGKRVTVSSGGSIMNFSESHGLVRPDGVYEYTDSGGTNNSNGSNYLDGADITEACKVSSFPSYPSSWSSSVVTSWAKRMKEKDEKKSRKKKKDEPFSPDQKASKAEGEEKSCCVCMDNKIDTRLDPCGHVILCIDCAKDIYKDEEKRNCPTCNSKFQKIQIAFL